MIDPTVASDLRWLRRSGSREVQYDALNRCYRAGAATPEGAKRLLRELLQLGGDS